jgi:predicted nucleotidyltransferase
MRLTPEDQTWLEAYRQALARQFPALVRHLILFGSKARGTATADSDLDLLVVIQQGDWRLKEAVTEAGYLLAIDTDVVPSIIVLTLEEWSRLQKRAAPFWQTVTRDGVTVQ